MANEFLSAVILLLLVIDPVRQRARSSTRCSRACRPPRRRCVIAARVRHRLRDPARLHVLRPQASSRRCSLSETSLSIAGGVILFMIAIRMVFGHPEGAFGAADGGRALHRAARHPAHRRPLGARHRDADGHARAGQGRHVGGRDHRDDGPRRRSCSLAGDRLQRRWASAAMTAIERLMGLILTAIAVEMLLGGIRAFVDGSEVYEQGLHPRRRRRPRTTSTTSRKPIPSRRARRTT